MRSKKKWKNWDAAKFVEYISHLLEITQIGESVCFALTQFLWREVGDSQALLVALEDIEGPMTDSYIPFTQIHWLVQKPITKVNKC